MTEAEIIDVARQAVRDAGEEPTDERVMWVLAAMVLRAAASARGASPGFLREKPAKPVDLKLDKGKPLA